MEWLELIDRDLLLWVNQHYTSFLDTIMVFASAKFGWTPLYVLLLFMLYKKFGLKEFIISIVSIAVLITIADQTSVSKKFFYVTALAIALILKTRLG